MITSGKVQLSCSAISYPIVFFPSTRYGSLSVEISNQPSAVFLSLMIRPQSLISPSTSVSRAPYCCTSIWLAIGARLTLVDGLINDCGRIINERKTAEGWFDIPTLKEPYRVEGKKTMGYEIAEQLNWTLPGVIIYPTGGGTGLIGWGKAFQGMVGFGWMGCEW